MCNCLAPCDARAVPAVGAAGGTHPPRSPTAARHQRSARCEMPTAGMSCPDHCRHRPGSSPLQHTAIQSWRMGSLLKFEKGVWADALNHKHRIRSFRLLMQHGDHGGSRVCKEKPAPVSPRRWSPRSLTRWTWRAAAQNLPGSRLALMHTTFRNSQSQSRTFGNRTTKRRPLSDDCSWQVSPVTSTG